MQFTANPWLREHVISQARHLAVDLAPDQDRMQEIASRFTERLPELFAEGSTGVADLFTTPEQREQLDRLTAVMSLLEGHADVVMDDVGPGRDRLGRRDPPQVQRAPQGRRLGSTGCCGACSGSTRRCAQYRDGAVFVRAVQRRGRHRRLQRGLDLARHPARSPARSPTPQPGSGASTPEPETAPGVTEQARPWGRPHPAVAAVRSAVRGVLAECDPGDARPRGVQRRSGLPRPRRRRPFEGRPARAAGRRRRRRPRPPARDRPRSRPPPGPGCVTCGSTRSTSSRARRRSAAAVGSRPRPGGALRRRSRPPGPARRPAAVLLGHTLRRPGRDGAARARPRLRGALARRDAASRAAPTAGRCSTSPGRRPGRPVAPSGIASWDDPMNEDPAFARVRARRAAADLERDLGPGLPAALARTRRPAARGRRPPRRPRRSGGRVRWGRARGPLEALADLPRAVRHAGAAPAARWPRGPPPAQRLEPPRATPVTRWSRTGTARGRSMPPGHLRVGSRTAGCPSTPCLGFE